MGTSRAEPSFERDIKPLFRARDRQSMDFAFNLWDYDDVRDNAQAILARLTAGDMPCDGAWTEERIALFRHWLEAGAAP